MVLDTKRRGARLIAARAMEMLANIHQSPSSALGEFPENELDAGAKNVWVELFPDKIIITGDGQGMVHSMAQEDYHTLNQYYDDIESGKGFMSFDIREMMQCSASLNSIEWMQEAIAFSGKQVKKTARTRGMRGIGALGFHQLGTSARFVTRPTKELWNAYREFDSTAPLLPPTFFVEPASAEQLDNYDVEYRSGETKEKLTDPDGNPLEHGTRVVIKGLKVDEIALRPSVIEGHFKTRFGGDVKAGARITIIDRISEEGRRSNGRRILIPPTSYKGMLIVDKTFTDRNSGTEYRVEMWYDPNARNLKPMIRRQLGDVRPLTDFSEFEGRSPWSSGRINGYAEYPNPDTWDTQKTSPLRDATWRMWVRRLQDVADEIETAIDEISQRARDEAVHDISNAVSKAAPMAMRELQYFEDVFVGLPESQSGTRTRNGQSKPRPAQLTVDAVVMNEYNRSVPDVAIELSQGGRVIAREITGRAGTVTFGPRPYGRYTLRMIVPEHMTPMDNLTQYPNFNLRDNQPGFRAVFKLNTGTPKRESYRIRRLSIYTTLLPDGNPYNASKLSRGLVEINSEGRHYKEALQQNDRERIAYLFAMYTASAITEYAFPNEDAPTLLMQANLLTGQIFDAVKGIMAAELKSVSRKKK